MLKESLRSEANFQEVLEQIAKRRLNDDSIFGFFCTKNVKYCLQQNDDF